MKYWMAVSLMLALATGAGCGSDGGKVDLGDDKVVKTGEKLSDYAGDWHGYAEAFQFNDGSDAIAIKLDAHGDGVIEVGEADPLPTPEADELYPPISQDNSWGSFGAELISGFSYPISAAKVESKRIQFETSTGEVVGAWCELQTPVQVEVDAGEGQWSCLPLPKVGYHAGDDGCYVEGDDSMAVPCAKLQCLSICRCTESSCEQSFDANVQFDGALQSEGEDLVGTLRVGLGEGDRITVRLTRE
jgi:hypothetical protein